MTRPKVIAIVPAAGSGRRLGLKKKKPLVLLGGRPVITYSLMALNRSSVIDGIIIAARKADIKAIKGLGVKFGFKKVIDVVEGGKTRQESVKNCLDSIMVPPDVVLIHDAARPFLEKETIKKSVASAMKFGASIVAVPECDTVKLVGKDGFVEKTLDRKRIFRAGTPQAFRYDAVKSSYGTGKRLGLFTDDAALAEDTGIKVKVIIGSYRNIKITTKEDLKLAEVLL
jgi:2-C-methyl-D-erythritol 4-phosphate cytidylyltransferase